MNTVASLRAQHYKVKVFHTRIYRFAGKKKAYSKHEILTSKLIPDNNEPDAKGGFTEVEIITPEGKIFRAGAACSRKDTFCKKRGVEIALGRALKLVNKENGNVSN